MRTLYLVTAFLCVLTVSILGFRGTTFTHPPMDVFPEWLFPGMKHQPKLSPADGERASSPTAGRTGAAPGDRGRRLGPLGQPLRDDAFLYQGKAPDGSFARDFPPRSRST